MLAARRQVPDVLLDPDVLLVCSDVVLLLVLDDSLALVAEAKGIPVILERL